MHEAIHHILTHCGGLKEGEEVFIVHDASTRDIADAFSVEAKNLDAEVVAAEVLGLNRHGVEPMFAIANVMRHADLTICLTRFSLAHTKARLGAKRFLSLPQYSWDVLNHPAVMVDYEAQAANVRRFADAFTNGNELRVVAVGTDVTMGITGRIGNYCPGFVRRIGDLGSPPDIEANVAPIEDSATGIWFDDLSMVAECGVGLNPLAKDITGNMLLDEAIFGSVHFGLGSNHTIGGKRDCGWHKDIVMPKASLWVDNVQMLKDGEIC